MTWWASKLQLVITEEVDELMVWERMKIKPNQAACQSRNGVRCNHFLFVEAERKPTLAGQPIRSRGREYMADHSDRESWGMGHPLSLVNISDVLIACCSEHLSNEKYISSQFVEPFWGAHAENVSVTEFQPLWTVTYQSSCRSALYPNTKSHQVLLCRWEFLLPSCENGVKKIW